MNDKEYVLDIDPSILELLGPSLYTNIYYVLAELIANAYDADANNVYISVKEDQIKVEDDGHGMSYKKGEVGKYLEVARISRIDKESSFTQRKKRKKMGRKGIGKLAALSVSENVHVLTNSEGEKSGFVLSRNTSKNKKLMAISNKDILFDFISSHGTCIIMKEPNYSLHKSMKAIQRNLLKIFPLVNKDFQIHLIRGEENETIKDFDLSIMSELCGLITLGEKFNFLSEMIPKKITAMSKELVETRESYNKKLIIESNQNIPNDYNLEVLGWIGVYQSSRGRKANTTDFPDNFISLLANEKLGEFNILPKVGQNKLNEVYVVGQLYVDIFELTELPDMSLANRQGYKSDDIRYQEVLIYVRKILLQDILNKRKKFTSIKNEERLREKIEDQKAKESELKKAVDKFKKDSSERATKEILKLGEFNEKTIKNTLTKSINVSSPILGIKSKSDSLKKKILISHTSEDQPLGDVIYSFLTFNGVPHEEILYTSSMFEESRIPEGYSIPDYLKDFFVESYSTNKIFVLFITSNALEKEAWWEKIEIGASWITKTDHKIFNIFPFKPKRPLDDDRQWHNTYREGDSSGDLWMNPLDADIFCQKLEDVVEQLGFNCKTRNQNIDFLNKLVNVRNKAL